MKYLKFFPAIAVLLCAAVSLQQYQAPAFEIEQPEKIELSVGTAGIEGNAEETKSEKKASAKKEKPDLTKKNISLPSTGNGTVQPATTGTSGSLQTVEEPAVYLDGTYEGSGTGFRGTIRVQVVVQGGKIANITVLESSDDHPFFENASALLSLIVQNQTTNVDAVSGATYSSKGILEAVRNALKQAINPEAEQPAQGNTDNTKEPSSTSVPSNDTKKETEKEPEEKPKNEEKEGAFPYKDGVYYGTGKGYRGDVTVAVTIQQETLQSIEVTDSQDDPAFFEKAETLLAQIVKKQSMDVDVVSGATYSSNGLLEAVKDAIAQAKKATKGEEKTPGKPSAKPSTKPSVKAGTEPSEKPSAPQKTSVSEEETSVPTEAQTTTQDEKQQYRDGTYLVETTCEPDEQEDFWTYRIQAKVTLQNDKITAITDIKGVGNDYDSNNDWYLNRAANGTKSEAGVVQQMTEQGTTEKIDAVSGATCSSRAIIDAVRKAFESARNIQK